MNHIKKTCIFVLLSIIRTVNAIEQPVNIKSLEHHFFNSNTTPFPFPDIYAINQTPLTIKSEEITTKAISKKPWTFMVYVAADNDLRAFAANNIKQMASIGSNQNINILVHLDIRLNGNQKITRRYYIEKNKLVPMDQRPETQRMDSGKPATLVSFCDWSIKNYPAQDYALILWNHGTGIIDPKHYKIIHPADLFMFNPKTNKLDLNRSVGFLDLLSYRDVDRRGICIDSTTGNYLTNQDLQKALKEIYTKVLHNKKLSIIGCDACLMSMIEVANIFKDYADIMVSSQEVELGTGWNYARILQPFSSDIPNSVTLAKHIVTSYKESYQQITNDFTQSAFNLSHTSLIEQNINLVAHLLIECLNNQKNNSVRTSIKTSRNKRVCTSFDEPSYTDLYHFYKNLQTNLSKFTFNNTDKNNLTQRLNQALAEGMQLISSTVLQNVAGTNLKMAHGISIYFPENRIHSSYLRTNFANENAWTQFLSLYLH